MGEILEFAEALWKGETTTYAHHPLSEPYGLDRVARDTWFQIFFSNSVIIETPEEGTAVGLRGVRCRENRGSTQIRRDSHSFRELSRHCAHVLGQCRLGMETRL
jgi:hypothetical protein